MLVIKFVMLGSQSISVLNNFWSFEWFDDRIGSNFIFSSSLSESLFTILVVLQEIDNGTNEEG